jgi:phosphate:Na+ symporter
MQDALSGGRIVFLVATILGGLGLFIYGMRVMTTGLQALAGTRMRGWLSRLTRNRFKGYSAGTAMGFLVHSGPTAVMLIGFINAGLLTLEASVPVMIGNNLGTTLSMQLFSFKIGEYCYFAIAAGLILGLVSRKEWVGELSRMLLGLGLLFLGMNTMSDAVSPLRDAGYFEGFLRHAGGATAGGMVLGIVVSSLATGIIQSSGAMIGMLFALAHGGVFADLQTAFPLILGAHIGTCVIGLFGSLGTNIEARRSAASHLLFNLLGGILAALMFPFYVLVVPAMGGDLVRQIANTHTMVQLVNGLILLPFVGAYARFVRFVTPSRSPPAARSHLEDDYLDTPEMAIVAVLQETRRMANMARRMVRMAMASMVRRSSEIVASVEREEESVDLLKDTLNDYLFRISRRPLSRRQALILQYLMRTVADIERIGDHAENLVEIITEKNAQKIWFDEDTVHLLIELYQRADRVLGLMVESLNPTNEQFDQCAEAIIEAREEYKAFSRQLRDRYTERVLSRQDDAGHGIVHSNIVTTLDRIVIHSRNVARVERSPLFRLKAYKLERRVESSPRPALDTRPKTRIDPSVFSTDDLDSLESEAPSLPKGPPRKAAD